MLEKAGALAEAARAYEEAGDHARAAKVYERLRDPDQEVKAMVSGGDFLGAGYALYRMNRKEEAVEVLKLTAPADKGYGRACFLMGRIMEDLGRTKEALRYYMLFVERSQPTQNTVRAWERLVGLLDEGGMPDIAVLALKKLRAEGLLSPEMEARLTEAEAQAGT